MAGLLLRLHDMRSRTDYGGVVVREDNVFVRMMALLELKLLPMVTYSRRKVVNPQEV